MEETSRIIQTQLKNDSTKRMPITDLLAATKASGVRVEGTDPLSHDFTAIVNELERVKVLLEEEKKKSSSLDESMTTLRETLEETKTTNSWLKGLIIGHEKYSMEALNKVSYFLFKSSSAKRNAVCPAKKHY